MAHNLNYNEQTGKHSFFSVKEKAWHNLGQIISDYPTSAEAIKHVGLNYTVEKRPLFTYDTENHTGDPVIPNYKPDLKCLFLWRGYLKNYFETASFLGNTEYIRFRVTCIDFV